MSDTLAFAPSEDSLFVVVTKDHVVFANDKGVPIHTSKASPDTSRGPLKILVGEHGWLVRLNGAWAMYRSLRGGQCKDCEQYPLWKGTSDESIAHNSFLSDRGHISHSHRSRSQKV